jgi:hypothetical protein
MVPTDLGKSLGKVEKTAVVRTAVPTPSNTLSNTHARIKLHSDGSKFTNLKKQSNSYTSSKFNGGGGKH